jgi:hypothetical protein
VGVEAIGDAADGFLLVAAIDDGVADGQQVQPFALAAAKDQPFEFFFFQKARDGPGGVAAIVPNPGVVAVGVEDDGALLIALF